VNATVSAENNYQINNRLNTMKKLQRNEMKKVKGGVDDEPLCLKVCNRNYIACVNAGGDINLCAGTRNKCRLQCLGCNTICT
jgi:hypothetical protein